VATKELIVVAGPNGAGKSTFVNSFLTERRWPYLSADLIAKEFPHLGPMSQQVAAGREFLQRLEEQLSKEDAKLPKFLASISANCRSMGSGLQCGRRIC
jgi:predicted ABC-type ATPase